MTDALTHIHPEGFQAGKGWPIRIIIFLAEASPLNNVMLFLFLFLLLPLCGLAHFPRTSRFVAT